MKMCSFPGCDQRHDSKGLCKSHNSQARKGKPLTPVIHKADTAEELFWRYVDKADNGCWLWTGHKAGRGYGDFQFNYKQHYAHRFSWELHVGPVPDGHHVDHHHPQRGCGNPLCVNPDHLDAVPPAINSQRMRKVRAASGVIGVHWHQASQSWHSVAMRFGKTYSFGYHKTVEEAATARVRGLKEIEELEENP